jgi:hypothetical protein
VGLGSTDAGAKKNPSRLTTGTRLMNERRKGSCVTVCDDAFQGTFCIEVAKAADATL